MGHTSREPCTKYSGPNYPFVRAENPNHWLVTFYNLEPGDTWNPLWAAELQGQLTLIPLANPAIWVFNGINVWCVLRYNLTVCHLLVRERPTRTFGFFFTIHFQQMRWLVNELLVPDGNFAFNGTAELIYRKG